MYPDAYESVESELVDRLGDLSTAVALQKAQGSQRATRQKVVSGGVDQGE